MMFNRENSLTQKLIKLNEIPKPEITWEKGKYTTEEILTRSALPRVIQYDVEVDDPSCKNLFLSTPLLAFKERMVRKVVASILCYDKNKERMVIVGDPLTIPVDYEGWFSLVTSSETSPEKLAVPHFTSIEQIVSSDVTSFLIGGSTCIQAVILNGNEIQCQHSLYPGERLTLVKTLCTQTKFKSRKYFKRTKGRKEEFAVCNDKLGREMTIPMKQEGIFYPIPSADVNMNDSTWEKSLASPFTKMFDNISLPCIVKLLYGSVPTTPCPFTGLLRLEYAYYEHSIVLSTILNLKNVLLEIPVDNVTPFRLAKDTAQLTTNIGYMRASKHCEFKADVYTQNMKVCKLYHKNKEKSEMVHNFEDVECRENIDPFLDDCRTRVSIENCVPSNKDESLRPVDPQTPNEMCSNVATKEQGTEEKASSQNSTKRNIDAKQVDQVISSDDIAYRQFDSVSGTRKGTYFSSLDLASRVLDERPRLYDKLTKPPIPISEKMKEQTSQPQQEPIYTAPRTVSSPIHTSSCKSFDSFSPPSADENIYSVPPQRDQDNFYEPVIADSDSECTDLDYDYPMPKRALPSVNVDVKKDRESSPDCFVSGDSIDTPPPENHSDLSALYNRVHLRQNDSQATTRHVSNTGDTGVHNSINENFRLYQNVISPNSNTQTSQLTKTGSDNPPSNNSTRERSRSGILHTIPQPRKSENEPKATTETHAALKYVQSAPCSTNLMNGPFADTCKTSTDQSTKHCRLNMSTQKHSTFEMESMNEHNHDSPPPIKRNDSFRNAKMSKESSLNTNTRERSRSDVSHAVSHVESETKRTTLNTRHVPVKSVHSSPCLQISGSEQVKSTRSEKHSGIERMGSIRERKFTGQRTLDSLSSTEVACELRKAKVGDKTIQDFLSKSVDGKLLNKFEKETLLERFPDMKMTDVLRIALFIKGWRSTT